MLCPSLDTFDNGYQLRDNYVKLLLEYDNTVGYEISRSVMLSKLSLCYSICPHNYSFYPIAHITMLRTTVMKASYLYRIASKAPKLFRVVENDDDMRFDINRII
jgi:hypothetical protein